MKLTNKLPRTLSIVAAILSLLSLIGGVISSVSSWIPMFRSGNVVIVSIVSYLLLSLATVFSIIVLFRGKKDSIAGVLLILCAVGHIGIGVISRFILIIFYLLSKDTMGIMFGSMVASNVFGLINGLVTALFFVLLAIECFNPGKFSTSKVKVVLFILPVVIAILAVFSTVSLQLHTMSADIVAFAVFAATTLLGNLISHVHILLRGIVFATPVYEKDPDAGYPAPPYTNV